MNKIDIFYIEKLIAFLRQYLNNNSAIGKYSLGEKKYLTNLH